MNAIKRSIFLCCLFLIPLLVVAQDNDSTLVGIFEDGRSYFEATYTMYFIADQYRMLSAYADGNGSTKNLRYKPDGRYVILLDDSETEEYYTITDEGLKLWDSEGLIVVCPWVKRPA